MCKAIQFGRIPMQVSAISGLAPSIDRGLVKFVGVSVLLPNSPVDLLDNPEAIGPSPAPLFPWQAAQFAVYNFIPVSRALLLVLDCQRDATRSHTSASLNCCVIVSLRNASHACDGLVAM